MIAFLSGTLEYLSGDLAVIDVGGVGYEVNVSAEVSGNLSSIGTGNISGRGRSPCMVFCPAEIWHFLSCSSQ